MRVSYGEEFSFSTCLGVIADQFSLGRSIIAALIEGVDDVLVLAKGKWSGGHGPGSSSKWAIGLRWRHGHSRCGNYGHDSSGGWQVDTCCGSGAFRDWRWICITGREQEYQADSHQGKQVKIAMSGVQVVLRVAASREKDLILIL